MYIYIHVFSKLETIFPGQYGVPEGMVFSFPVTIDSSGKCKLIGDIAISEEVKEKFGEIVKVYFKFLFSID